MAKAILLAELGRQLNLPTWWIRKYADAWGLPTTKVGRGNRIVEAQDVAAVTERLRELAQQRKRGPAAKPAECVGAGESGPK